MRVYGCAYAAQMGMCIEMLLLYGRLCAPAIYLGEDLPDSALCAIGSIVTRQTRGAKTQTKKQVSAIGLMRVYGCAYAAQVGSGHVCEDANALQSVVRTSHRFGRRLVDSALCATGSTVTRQIHCATAQTKKQVSAIRLMRVYGCAYNAQVGICIEMLLLQMGSKCRL